ncbi:hypothetical protein GEMRC1_009719 [Eukaryota sp. GEM-RC1]
MDHTTGKELMLHIPSKAAILLRLLVQELSIRHSVFLFVNRTKNMNFPLQPPFIAEIVTDANTVTEADIKQVFSSLRVKEVRPTNNMPGTFFVKFRDVHGLEQCLDKYWMFKIHGHPIRTYVASAPQSSVKPLNSSTFSSKPNTESKPLELLPLTSSFQSPSRCLHFPQSLLILINIHLLKSLCKSYPDWKRDYPRRYVPIFFKKIGYVSHNFFESALLSAKVFVQTNTFHIVPEDLPQLCSFASFFRADVQSVFLHVYGIFNVEKFFNYSNLISGLELKIRNENGLEFLYKSSLFLPRLKELHVNVCYGFSISMPFIEMLKVNTTVTRVNLGHNYIVTEGARALADALKVNSTITSVSLVMNLIKDEGARALANALKVNTSLTSVDLRDNYIKVEGARALADALKVNCTITSVSLDSNSIGVEGTRALADALKVNSTITSVSLDSNSIGVEGARALADALKVNSTITSVSLDSNSIGVEGARALANALKVNSTITSVSLDSNSIGVEGARALAKALKVNSTITSVSLRSNSIGSEGGRALADALKVNTSVSCIDLEGNSIGVEGARALADALKINYTVTSVILSHNSIGVEGARALADALKVNGFIAIIDLGYNYVKIEGARALADALKLNTAIISLGLSYNYVKTEGARALADALSSNTTVKSIHLGDNFIESEGASALLEALKVNGTVEVHGLRHFSGF